MRKIEKKLSGTYEKILRTTMELIQEEGSQKLTMKKVAERAKVNKALVNYHFTKKENLINEAMSVMSKDLWTMFEILDNSELDAEIRLEKFLKNFLNLIIMFKESIKYFLCEGEFLFEEQKQITAYIKNVGIQKIKKVFLEIYGEENKFIDDVFILQILSALVLPNMVNPKVNEIFKVSLPDTKSQIESLTNKIIFKLKN